MRMAILVGGVAGVSVTALLLACGSSSTNNAGDDQSSSGNPSSSGDDQSSSGNPSSSGGTDAGSDGGSSSGGTLLKDNAFLLGITADDYVVYQTLDTPSVVEAVPVAGGAVVPIASGLADTDIVTVSGAAVAWWTNVTNDIGTLNVWTKANGAKTAVVTGSSDNLFAASDDGARLAFSVNATATSSDLAVSASGTIATTAVLTGANAAIDLAAAVDTATASATCPVTMVFRGKVLFLSYCTGTGATTATARIETVPDGATPTPKRLDTNGNGAGTVTPSFTVDTNGTNLFAVTTGGTGKLFTAAGVGGTSLDTTTAIGVMLSDGSAALYRTTTPAALKRATVAAATKTSLVAAATSVTELLGLTPDQKHVMFSELAPDATNGTVDIHVVDTTTATQTPVDVVKTATGAPFGFTGSNTFVVYGTDVTATGLTLKAQPIAGGAETTLGTGVADALPLDTGTGVLYFDNLQTSGQIQTADVHWVDASKGGAATTVATSVPGGAVQPSGSKLFFTTLPSSGKPAVYVTTLP